MLTKIFPYILLFATVGCVTYPGMRPVTSDIYRLVDELSDLGIETKKPLYFADLQEYGDDRDSRVLGVCVGTSIWLDYKEWQGRSDIHKKALLIHEYGHCLYGMYHNDMLFPDLCPVSLMHSYIPPEYCLNRHWDFYLKEFYNRNKRLKRGDLR